MIIEYSTHDLFLWEKFKYLAMSLILDDVEQVAEKLAIDVELFLQNLNFCINDKKLSELDRLIICKSLLGYSPQEIASKADLPQQKIRDRLAKNIYPKVAELMEVEQNDIAGN